MWINYVLVGVVDRFLDEEKGNGGLWMRLCRAFVDFIDRHLFAAGIGWEDLDADIDVEAGVDDAWAGEF